MKDLRLYPCGESAKSAIDTLNNREREAAERKRFGMACCEAPGVIGKAKETATVSQQLVLAH